MKIIRKGRAFAAFMLAAFVLALGGCGEEPAGIGSESGAASNASGTADNTDQAQPIRVGFGKKDITPELRVQLRGQNYDRIASEVHDSLYATAVAWESADSGMQAIVVSIDNIVIDGTGLIEDVRDYVEGKLDGFSDVKNILLFGTHIHTGPWLYDCDWSSSEQFETSGSEYYQYLVPRVGDAVLAAWNDRKEGSLSHIEGSAEVGWCRIVRYKDGKDEMYGSPLDSRFQEFTSGNNHRLNLLYCYQGDTLKGVLLNANTPFQSCETERQVSADITGRLRERFPELSIIPIIGAAGDQSPYDLTKGDISSQMGFARQKELGDRYADEIERYIEDGTAAKGKKSALVLAHNIRDITVDRTKSYGGNGLKIELHAIRLGDMVLVNNPFELYIDYGFAIKALSMAPITWVGQLSSNYYNIAGDCTYLPTAYAEQGEAYGSTNRQVASEGGAQLVEQTVAFINEMFGSPETVMVSHTDEKAVYTGSWAKKQDSGAYGHTRTEVSEKGAAVEFTFTGTGVKWFDTADTDKGIAEVYIDGQLAETVDEYNELLLYQSEMFRVTGLENGEHTIRIVCTGEKRTSAAGSKVGVDFFVVESQGSK